MSTLIEASDGIVPAEPENDTNSETGQPGESIGEAQLTQEIATLWSEHVRLSADRKLMSKDLRQIKEKLAERLFEMKALLSKPGRGGQLRGWLKGQKIPCSAADRLVHAILRRWVWRTKMCPLRQILQRRRRRSARRSRRTFGAVTGEPWPLKRLSSGSSTASQKGPGSDTKRAGMGC